MPVLESTSAAASTPQGPPLPAWALWTALAAVGLACAPPAGGQLPQTPVSTEAPADAPDEVTSESVNRRRDEVRGAIAERRRRTAAARGEPARALEQELERLESIERLLALQLAELRRAGEIEEEAERQQDLLAASLETRFGHPPPYSVAELDAVLDELEAASAAREVAAAEHRQSTREVERAEERLAEAERRERLARDATSGPAPEQEPALRLLALEADAARERLRLRRLQLEDAERALEVQTTREGKLETLAAQVRERIEPTPEQLKPILEALAERNRELDLELARVQEEAEAANERWAAAQERVELAAAPDATMVARAAARQLELKAAEHRLELLQNQILRAERLDDFWQLRFDVLGDRVAASELRRHAGELADRLGELERERRVAESRLAEQRLAHSMVRDRLAAGEPGRRNGTAGGEEDRWLGEQAEQLQRVIGLYERELEDLDRTARLVRRLKAEIGDRTGIGLGERLGVLWGDLADLWRFEITEADQQPITVGKVVLALLLILFGYVVAKLLSRRLGRLVLPRLGLTTGGAAALQTLVYYALLAIFVLWALHVVSIPLTVFTVLGGVLAIGIGFGSQNIVNNFISGLILLAEQPIKVGDLIDVDGVFGQVERIGPRSSRIRAGDNTHVIVPNSAFLEKNVLNWTVSDDVVRTYVDVGVAYGSPVEEVARLLRQAIDDEPGILDQPPPEVLFRDFGDNALTFRSYFWVRVARSLDRDRFQSRLRFRIDGLFKQAGIVIAFPQRDVHLDSLSPVEVRLVGGAAGGGAGGETPP